MKHNLITLHIGGVNGVSDSKPAGPAEPNKPQQCRDCPLYRIGKGFVPGTYHGQPLWVSGPAQGLAIGETVPNLIRLNDIPTLGFCGEAPSVDELFAGRPFAGRAGGLLKAWVFDNAGIAFNNVVIDNVLRCAQPDNKMPERETMQRAARFCSQYDRWDEMNLAADVFTFHPAALMRDPVPLPLVIHDVGKARRLVENDEKSVRVLLGATALSKFYDFTHYRGVGFWRGHVHRPAAKFKREK